MAKIGLYPTGGHLVKRVIGVAGDIIECCDDKGRMLVNGEPLDEGDYVKRLGAACNGPMPTNGACDEDWTVGSDPRGPHLRDGRQPLALGRLHPAHVPAGRDRVRARRRVRPGRPRGRQGLRAAVARATASSGTPVPTRSRTSPTRPREVGVTQPAPAVPRWRDRTTRRRALRLRARPAPRRHRARRRRRRGGSRGVRRTPGRRSVHAAAGQGRHRARARRLQAAHRGRPGARLRPGACGGRSPGRWS